MKTIALVVLLLVASCRTEFLIINGQTIICTICGTMTMCNG